MIVSFSFWASNYFIFSMKSRIFFEFGIIIFKKTQAWQALQNSFSPPSNNCNFGWNIGTFCLKYCNRWKQTFLHIFCFFSQQYFTAPVSKRLLKKFFFYNICSNKLHSFMWKGYSTTNKQTNNKAQQTNKINKQANITNKQK